MNSVVVGDSYKVLLPGESPWAECVALLPEDKWVGRIINHLVASSPEKRREVAKQFGAPGELPKLHDWKMGDLIIFEVREAAPELYAWMPITNQHPGGAA